MKILVLNCGSSSVKYALYDWAQSTILTQGNIERIGSEGGPANHQVAISEMLQGLQSNDIHAVGHRVVHGGDKFNKSVRVTEEVLDTIRAVSSLAPLHNPPNIIGIESAMAVLPDVPQIAVFDTAFHQTLPREAYLYPVPYSWYEDFGVRKYGFHGSSHLYVTKRAASFLGKPRDTVNLITLHIGNGVSFSAIRNGVSVDTSMGMTPLEGAMMGTRSGDIDPAIVGFMADKLDASAANIINSLNKKSGHFGVTEGRFVDRRDIEKAANEGNVQAKLSLDMEIYRIKKYIGAYMAVLGNVDALVFTAGVGENNATIRAGALSGLERLGIILDVEKNKSVRSSSGETIISTPESPVNVLVIPTNEEAVLVEDVVAILENRYDDHTRYVYQFEG